MPPLRPQWRSELAAPRQSAGSGGGTGCWEDTRLSSTGRREWDGWHTAPEPGSDPTTQTETVRHNQANTQVQTQTEPSALTCLFCRLSHLAFLFSALLRGKALPFWFRCRGVSRFSLRTANQQRTDELNKEQPTRSCFNTDQRPAHLEEVWSTSSSGWFRLDKSRLYLVL